MENAEVQEKDPPFTLVRNSCNSCSSCNSCNSCNSCSSYSSSTYCQTSFSLSLLEDTGDLNSVFSKQKQKKKQYVFSFPFFF